MNPFIASKTAPLARLRTWLGGLWHKHASIRRARLELGADPQETARVAHDLGLSLGDLHQLARHPPDAAARLRRRMAVLQLDPQDLARREGAVMQDMQRLCTLCDRTGRCAAELDRRPQDPAWRQYCPNSGTLTVLQARWPGSQGSLPTG